jgi:predicted CopG family antitoxin
MIRVRESTHKELVKLAKYSDAMSDIIEKLLASYKDKSKDVSSRNIKK